MSLIISKKGNKYFVHNQITEKVLGHFNTKKEAINHAQEIRLEESSLKKDFNKSTSIFPNFEDKEE